MHRLDVSGARAHVDTRRATSCPSRIVVGAVSVLGVALALNGCSVGPKFHPPDVTAEVGGSWTANGQPGLSSTLAPDTTWWRSFNDPALDSLVEIAYRQNLPLQIAGLRILEARAQLGLAAGRKWPQVQLAFGNATAVGLSDNAPNNFGFDRNFWDYQVGFDALWETDFWGKYGEAVQAEHFTVLTTMADYDNALVSLTAEVARTYALIRTYEVLIDQARQNVAIQQEGLRIAQARFRNGATSELDVFQSNTLLASTQATIPQLEATLQQVENAMCTLIGRPSGSVTAVLQGSRGIPAATADVAVGIPADLLRRRPDVRGVELLAAAQCERIGVARSDLYPSLSLFGSIGLQASSGAGSINGHTSSANLFDPASLFYAIGPRLLWPFFNYSRITNNVRVQDARLEQLLIDYQNTVLRAAQEVEDGLAGYLKAREAAALQETAASAAQRSVEIAMIQYREGAVDFQRVLDAQRSELEEENALARTRSSIATNLISLYKAMGGGWELRQGRPVVADSTRIEMQNRTNWGDYFSKPPPDSTSKGKGSSSTPR
jgi:NodT family efflux transporter outer membrane factor (OMF) lipoprotein